MQCMGLPHKHGSTTETKKLGGAIPYSNRGTSPAKSSKKALDWRPLRLDHPLALSCPEQPAKQESTMPRSILSLQHFCHMNWKLVPILQLSFSYHWRQASYLAQHLTAPAVFLVKCDGGCAPGAFLSRFDDVKGTHPNRQPTHMISQTQQRIRADSCSSWLALLRPDLTAPRHPLQVERLTQCGHDVRNRDMRLSCSATNA